MPVCPSLNQGCLLKWCPSKMFVWICSNTCLPFTVLWLVEWNPDLNPSDWLKSRCVRNLHDACVSHRVSHLFPLFTGSHYSVFLLTQSRLFHTFPFSSRIAFRSRSKVLIYFFVRRFCGRANKHFNRKIQTTTFCIELWDEKLIDSSWVRPSYKLSVHHPIEFETIINSVWKLQERTLMNEKKLEQQKFILFYVVFINLWKRSRKEKNWNIGKKFILLLYREEYPWAIHNKSIFIKNGILFV